MIDWDQLITPEHKAAAAKQALRERIAARRYEAETSGIEVAGVPVDTGRDSQGLIAGAALQSVLDPDYTVRWKAANGRFVELTAQQIVATAQDVRAHVQACFDREAELVAALEAGEFYEAMLEEGWPVRQPSVPSRGR